MNRTALILFIVTDFGYAAKDKLGETMLTRLPEPAEGIDIRHITSDSITYESECDGRRRFLAGEVYHVSGSAEDMAKYMPGYLRDDSYWTSNNPMMGDWRLMEPEAEAA